MKRTRHRAALAALGTAVALVLSGCGGPTSGGSSAGNGPSGGEAATGAIHNPSDVKGGTLRFGNSGDWDSLDPADTYLTYSWNSSEATGAQC